jgi:hypothetical protein
MMDDIGGNPEQVLFMMEAHAARMQDQTSRAIKQSSTPTR